MQEARDDVETWSAVEAGWRSVIRICLHVFAQPWIASIFRLRASCAKLFLRPWCLNSHSLLYTSLLSQKETNLKYTFCLAIGLGLAWLILIFCWFTKKEGWWWAHLQSIYKGRYGLELALGCVNEQHWMDLVGWGTKEDINSVLAPFLPIPANHTMQDCTKPCHTIPYQLTMPYHTITYHTSYYYTNSITMAYHIIPANHTMPYHAIHFHTIPDCTIPYQLTIPCHAIVGHHQALTSWSASQLQKLDNTRSSGEKERIRDS